MYISRDKNIGKDINNTHPVVKEDNMQDKDESIYSRNKHFSFERIHKSCSSNHNYSQILKKIAIE